MQSKRVKTTSVQSEMALERVAIGKPSAGCTHRDTAPNQQMKDEPVAIKLERRRVASVKHGEHQQEEDMQPRRRKMRDVHDLSDSTACWRRSKAGDEDTRERSNTWKAGLDMIRWCA
jgi:hypothetical protein